MARTKTIKKFDVTTDAFPYTLNLASRTDVYKISGTKTLEANVAITYTGTPVAGQTVLIDWAPTITPGNYKVTVFNTDIPAAYVRKKIKIFCEYNGSWEVYFLVDVSTWTGTQGSVVVVGATGIEPLDAKTSGRVLIGDGTDLKSVALSGDITVTSAGVTAIGTDKVLAAMINDGEITNAHLNAAAAIALTKLAALTASKIPVLNASGFIEAGTVDASKLAYLNVTTPGTAEASKAVVLDASKKISDIDITALKLNGTTITATPAQINYLANVTSDVQAQIDASVSKNSYTEISADTTATAADLKNCYVANTGAGAVNLTLPLGSTLDVGTTVKLTRIGANDAKFVPNASDKLYPISSTTADTPNVPCSATGKSVTVVLKSATEWQTVQLD